MFTSGFPAIKQLDSVDCGPTCLQIICRYYKKRIKLEHIREISSISKEGVSLLSLSKAGEMLGFDVLNVKLSIQNLVAEAPFPAILLWDLNHYVVLYKIDNHGTKNAKFYISDPRIGLKKVSESEFISHWVIPNENNVGVALLLEPTDVFFKIEDADILETSNNFKKSISFLLKYIKKYKTEFFFLGLGISIVSLITLIFPILTKYIVDVGIGKHDLSFITLILIAQLILVISSTVVDFLRRQILLHIGIRINVNIASDFLLKIFRLPISFFESKNLGDIINRLNDQRRIESFITNNTLSTILLLFNFIGLLTILKYFDSIVFFVFIIGTVLSIIWMLMFQKNRKDIDHRMFRVTSHNNDQVYEMVNGMQEIKLNSYENHKNSQWRSNQISIFHINLASLRLEQYQQIGSMFFTQLKNVIITFISAQAVVNGQISIGTMVSINLIVGQLNAPVQELIGFFKSFQLTSISIERIFEVLGKKEEDENQLIDRGLTVDIVKSLLDKNSEIKFENVSFRYGGHGSPFALKNLNVSIPLTHTTAIVGASGSGKSTLIKLLLRYYEPTEGEIKIGNLNINKISPSVWREVCGAVVQEGFIFSDTVEANIKMAKFHEECKTDLDLTMKLANVSEFIDMLPFKEKTKVGQNGLGLSAGQRQRILIARAIYKDPKIFVLDEATSALDAINEKQIIDNLNSIFINKTAIVVAHRLSTVKNADQIIVLDSGAIIEVGSHEKLVSGRGSYFNLIKNQLELGN